MKMLSSWWSPGRVNLIGEHTDYNQGYCLPLAIGRGCTATVSRIDDDVIEIESAQRDMPIEVPLSQLRPGALDAADEWAGHVAGVVWAMRARGHPVSGLSVSVDGDLPPGAGLSSSAAMECAVAAAVNDLLALGMDQSGLVEVARRAEIEFVGVPTGGMDQLASLYGEAGHVLLCDMRSFEVTPIPFDLEAAGLTLLVVDSRAPHQLTGGLYAQRRNSCEQAAQLLGVAALRDLTLEDLPDAVGRLADDRMRRCTRHVVTENDRTLAVAQLLGNGQIRAIGPLLTASHESLRDDFEVSVPEVDLAVEVMLTFGAYGARITGRGFGGCAIALMEPDQARAASVGITAAFAGRNYIPPISFSVTAGAGTHPVEPA